MNTEQSATRKGERKSYLQRWRDSWETDPKFVGWLSKSLRSTAEKDLAYCNICHSDITCGKSEITRHLASKRHKLLSEEENLEKKAHTGGIYEKHNCQITLEDCNAGVQTSLETAEPMSTCSPELLKRRKNQTQDYREMKTAEIEDKYDSFGKYVAGELEGISAEMSTFALKLICDIVYEAKIGTLNQNSKLCHNVPMLTHNHSSSIVHNAMTLPASTTVSEPEYPLLLHTPASEHALHGSTFIMPNETS